LSLAVEAADAGYVLLHPTSARMLGSAVSTRLAVDRPDTMEQLTAREREVLGLMSDGLGNKEIAVRLGISEHTVKFHASSILGKLSASTRTEAVSQGIRRGLIAV
jgi:DNA-binding NarL/FixJ family response regulator